MMTDPLIGPGHTHQYDVLDQNGDVLASTDSWWIACHTLQDWQTGERQGAVRDNSTDLLWQL